MKSKDLPAHPLANLFPLLTGRDFEALKADIAAHGLREAIWTYQGQILDGRNRYRACREAGIEPTFREWDGNGSLVAFVLSLNLHRRHLDAGQRAAVAAEVLPHLEEEAARRKKSGKSADGAAGGRGRKKANQPAHLPGGLPDDGEARKQAAKLVGVSARYVSMAKKVKEGDPEQFERVKAGRQRLHRAELHVRREEYRRQAAESERQREEERRRQGLCGEHVLEVKGSRTHARLAELKAEVLARPEFVARQQAIEDMARRSEALWAEVERLKQEAYALGTERMRAEADLKNDAYRTVEEENGRAVYPTEQKVYVYDKEVQAKLEEAVREGDWATRHRLLLQAARRCTACEDHLDERDDIPGRPGWRYTVCAWCREHLGETHCWECGAPLAEEDKEEGLCAECDPPPSPEERQRLARLDEALHQFLAARGTDMEGATWEDLEAWIVEQGTKEAEPTA
jgi:hypothetical protein